MLNSLFNETESPIPGTPRAGFGPHNNLRKVTTLWAGRPGFDCRNWFLLFPHRVQAGSKVHPPPVQWVPGAPSPG